MTSPASSSISTRLANRARAAPATTIGALARLAERRFKAAKLAYGHGTASARDEAVYLTLHALGLPPDRFPAARRVSAAAAARAMNLYEQRIRLRVPAAYLTGEAWLGPYRFSVDSRVIVPRSYIAELLLDATSPCWPASSRVRRVLDLCTGSGCLAILAAKHFPRALVDAADISRDALDVARVNVSRYRLTRRVRLVHSDYFQALAKRRYDVILSNPPYVRVAVMRRLPREYRKEPALALAGGADGLDAVRVILARAARHLTPGGVLVVECGHARERVERAFPRLPFFWLETGGGDDCVFVLTREELVRWARGVRGERGGVSGARRG
jgi:ribosomal protein L3 glutamine methyltransferase